MLLALALACGSPSADSPAVDTDKLEAAGDWLTVVALRPQAFAAITGPGLKDGWVAMADNDHAKAASLFVGDDPVVRRSRARAELAVSVLYADLDQSRQVAISRAQDAYSKREQEVPESVARLWSISDRCEDAGAITDVPEYTQRAGLHAAAADSPQALVDALLEPYAVDDSAGFERKLWDPCGYATLHRVWADRARADGSADLGGSDEGLETTLFAPWLTVDDVLAYTPTPYDVPDTAGLSDEAQAAREHVRAFDEALNAHEAALLEVAGDDGRALLRDIGMRARLRQAWLVSRARFTLLADHPRQALTYAEMAVDVSDRHVGSTNAPQAFSVLAHAQLVNGHTRESLGALRPIADAHPELVGLMEHVGDLAVLEGLDRTGDSKEN